MDHVVTSPRAPFTTADGLLEVHQIPAARDNLVWLLRPTGGDEVAAVDGPDASAVLAYCEARGLRLTTILNTHTHGDHIGINRDLAKRGLLDGMRVVGAAATRDAIPGLTEAVSEGDTVRLGDATARVLLTEGHIDGHVSYVFSDALFCGDTLFAGGCGYLFDGPPAKMHASLGRLGQLPEGTRVCCAHEYTEDNLRFAFSVEPDNAALADRIRAVWALRARGECAVPSTVGEELRTNPFLRHHSATLRARVAEALPEQPRDTDEQVFAATRLLKNKGAYKAAGDTGLPL
ncbi:MAG: hydroxyacylglutathione hydrolase [Polyangiales bacterium]|nr:hydroxyacylglutathione hydrolase [Myxococcales bacterium]